MDHMLDRLAKGTSVLKITRLHPSKPAWTRAEDQEKEILRLARIGYNIEQHLKSSAKHIIASSIELDAELSECDQCGSQDAGNEYCSKCPDFPAKKNKEYWRNR